MKYKLRAECTEDVLLFIQKAFINMTSFSMCKDEKFPDVEFEFETELTLDEIISILKKLKDGHVMYQTVKPVEQYTNERDYNL